jgi:MFS family permease
LKLKTDPNKNPLERKAIFGIICASHVVNHFQGSMVAVLFPLMMKDLGFGYLELGFISTLRGIAGNFLQAIYGFLVPYIKRAVILGTGNVIMGFAVLATGFASSYPFVLWTRVLSGVGASAQHPVGSTMLATHFPEARARTLALHNTAGTVGSVLAPLIAGLLLIYVDWRSIFWIVGGISFLAGVPYFVFRESVQPAAPSDTSRRGKRSRVPQGWDAYKACLKNRNFLIISLVLMVGAAGRGGGVNTTYLVPHFVNDLKMDVTHASVLFTILQVTGLVSPVLWGWASDRVSRVGTIQLSLFLSCVSTVWLGWEDTVSGGLLASIVFYGLAVHSRQTLTMALLTDVVDDRVIDAAFSLYYTIGFISAPFWTLLTGWMMQRFGFFFAFSVIGTSYLLGMALLLFLHNLPPKNSEPA